MSSAFVLNSLLVITCVLVALEVGFSIYERKSFYTVKDTLYNFYLMILNTALAFGMIGITILVLDLFYAHSINNHLTGFWYWFALLILLDFAYYVLHVVDHQSRFFWAIHVTHHNSELFNLTTGFRSSVFQPLYRFIYFIPLAMLGFSAIDILFMHSICQTWGVLVHTKYIKRMPAWVEMIFVTPSHHRVHHASNILYLDRNMGMFLIIWDRIFNTFQDEVEWEKVKYGLTKNVEKITPITVWNHEWIAIWKDLKRSDKWSDKLKYIFYPPGWSHDGSSKTTSELREEISLGFTPEHLKI